MQENVESVSCPHAVRNKQRLCACPLDIFQVTPSLYPDLLGRLAPQRQNVDRPFTFICVSDARAVGRYVQSIKFVRVGIEPGEFTATSSQWVESCERNLFVIIILLPNRAQVCWGFGAAKISRNMRC